MKACRLNGAFCSKKNNQWLIWIVESEFLWYVKHVCDQQGTTKENTWGVELGINWWHRKWALNRNSARQHDRQSVQVFSVSSIVMHASFCHQVAVYTSLDLWSLNASFNCQCALWTFDINIKLVCEWVSFFFLMCIRYFMCTHHFKYRDNFSGEEIWMI